jgi:outer membrane protein TolC
MRNGSRRRERGLALAAIVGLAVSPLPAQTGSLPPLDLGALLVEAESRNPAILAALARRGAAEEAPVQAEALPDPVASVGFTNESLDEITLGTSMMSNLAFSYTQQIPRKARRQVRTEVARAGVDVAANDAEAVRLRVLSEVKIAYAEVFRIDHTATILEENRRLLESLLRAARGRYEAGQAPLESVLRAQTELLEIDANLEGLRHERAGAGQMLNSLLGRTLDEPLGPAEVAPVADPYRHTSVGTSAVSRSPEVRRAEAAARREEAQARLVEEDGRTDLSWSAVYQNRGDLEPLVGGTLGFRLPAFRKDRIESTIRQSRHEAEAARRDVESREAASLAEARHWATQAERAEAMMRIYAEGVLPQARSAVDSAAAAYAAGEIPFVSVIEGFQTILRYEVEYERMRAERIQALANLEPLIAMRLVFPGLETSERPSLGETGE